MLFIDNFALALAFRKRVNLGSTLRLRMQKYTEKAKTWNRNLGLILGSPVPGSITPEGQPLYITEGLLREQSKLQREYFAKPVVRPEKVHPEIFDLVQKENALRARAVAAEEAKAASEAAGLPRTQIEKEYNDALHRIPLATLIHTTNELNAALVAAGQLRSEWEEGGVRYKLAQRKRLPEWKIYKQLLTVQAAESTLSMAKAQPGADDAHVRSLQIDVEAEKAEAARLMHIHGHDPEHWKPDRGIDPVTKEDLGPGLLWARQHHFEAVTKVSTIYQRLLQSAAARSLEFFQLKAQVTGQKERDHVMYGMLSRYGAMETDIKAFNAAIKELPDRYRPKDLDMAAFVDTDAPDTLGPDGRPLPHARDALFFLELCKAELLLGKSAHGPKDIWASSADVRVGINVQQRRDRSLEELDLLRKEWARLVDWTRTILITMWEFVSFPTDETAPYVNSVYDKLWNELRGAKDIVSAAGKSEGVFDADDLQGIVISIEQRLDLFFRPSKSAPPLNLTRRRANRGEPQRQPQHEYRPGWVEIPPPLETGTDETGTDDILQKIKRDSSEMEDYLEAEPDGEEPVLSPEEAAERDKEGLVNLHFVNIGARIVVKNYDNFVDEDQEMELDTATD